MSFSAASALATAKHNRAVKKTIFAYRATMIISSSRCGSANRWGSGKPRARDSKDLVNFGQENDTEFLKIYDFTPIRTGRRNREAPSARQHSRSVSLSTQSLP